MLQMFTLLILLTVFVHSYEVRTKPTHFIKVDGGAAHSYHEEGTIVHTTDIDAVIEDGAMISENLNQSGGFCSLHSECTTHEYLNLVRGQLALIELKKDNFMVNIHKGEILNFMSVGLKFSFGVLDSDDAERYGGYSTNIYKQNYGALILIQNLKMLAKNTMATMNSHMRLSHNNFDELQEGSGEANEAIEHLTTNRRILIG